eukprot:SAG31_NODE_21704_length_543_cov_0.605856_1_plen_30_part_01
MFTQDKRQAWSASKQVDRRDRAWHWERARA